MSRDVTATLGVIRQELRTLAKGKPQATLFIECGITLLERFLIDVNRIADAAETLAFIETARDKREREQ
jgi:hypothetical protein